ncbi:MAG TPA: hypothetical protein VGA37_06695 [Gemmatimonadales bacterium]
MFLELAEFLRCPSDHEEKPLVVATGAMKRRSIVFGTIGCPVCRKEFLIIDGVARLGEVDEVPAPESMAASDMVHAWLGLASPGGYVVLVGSAGQLAAGLTARMEEVRFIAVNPIGEVGAPRVSVIRGPGIMVRSGMARGVVVGAERASEPWLREAARVLLRGQRLVVLTEKVTPPDGVDQQAVGHGAWVGVKR